MCIILEGGDSDAPPGEYPRPRLPGEHSWVGEPMLSRRFRLSLSPLPALSCRSATMPCISLSWITSRSGEMGPACPPCCAIIPVKARMMGAGEDVPTSLTSSTTPTLAPPSASSRWYRFSRTRVPLPVSTLNAAEFEVDELVLASSRGSARRTKKPSEFTGLLVVFRRDDRRPSQDRDERDERDERDSMPRGYTCTVDSCVPSRTDTRH